MSPTPSIIALFLPLLLWLMLRPFILLVGHELTPIDKLQFHFPADAVETEFLNFFVPHACVRRDVRWMLPP